MKRNLLCIVALALAAVLLVLTNWVKPTKNLHPIVFIALSAVVGVVFHFAGVKGAALVIAALQAEGRSAVHQCRHIQRGYADLAGDLAGLGARVRQNTE